jgi:hypothetical protein
MHKCGILKFSANGIQASGKQATGRKNADGQQTGR